VHLTFRSGSLLSTLLIGLALGRRYIKWRGISWISLSHLLFFFHHQILLATISIGCSRDRWRSSGDDGRE
jgi:hypothetical protein